MWRCGRSRKLAALLQERLPTNTFAIREAVLDGLLPAEAADGLGEPPRGPFEAPPLP